MEKTQVYVLDDSDLSVRDDRIKVDILHIIGRILFYLPEIILPAMAVGIASMLAFVTLVTPRYTSTTKINMLPMNSTASYSLNAQLLTPMMANCVNVIRSRYVAEKTINYFGLDCDYREFQNNLSVENEPNSSILSISVTDKDPLKAKQIASFVRGASIREITNTVGFTNISVMEESSYPERASQSPIIIGLFCAFLTGVAVALIIMVRTIASDTHEANRKSKKQARRKAAEKDTEAVKAVKAEADTAAEGKEE